MCWVSWTRSLHFSWPTTLARSNSGQTLCLGWTWWIEAHTEILFPRYDISKAGKHGWNISFPSPVSFTECHAAFFWTGSKLGVGPWGGPTASMGTGWTEAPDQRKGGGRQGRMEPIGLQELVWKTRVVVWSPRVPCYGMLCQKKWSSEINGTIVQLSFTYFCGNSIWMNMTVCTCRYL